VELNKVLNVEPIPESRTIGLHPGWGDECQVPGLLCKCVHIDRIHSESGGIIDAVLGTINLDSHRRALNADDGNFRDTRASDCDDLNDIRVAVRGDGLLDLCDVCLACTNTGHPDDSLVYCLFSLCLCT
jgi:hypothetical protein